MTRDEKGRFPKGVSGNPRGRSKRATEEAYLDILKKEVTPDDWREIVRKAVVDAKRGDSVARKFLSDYIVGVPIQKVEADVKNNTTIGVRGVDYRTVAAALAPGSIPDSDAPSEGENPEHGPALG